MNWLLAPHSTVFAGAFILLLCFALLEGISLLLGLGISEWLSDLFSLPDSADGPAPDLSAGADMDLETGSGSANPVLSWLEIGRVPALISLCAFLAAFSISGMFLQQVLVSAGLPPLIQPVAAAIAFLVGLPLLKLSNRLLGKFWPQDESSAFAPSLLIGRVGTVTIGTATADRAAEVRVTGPDGRSHYIMCYAAADPVAQGGEILLLSRDDATGHYRGAANTNPDLSPELYT